AVRAVEHGALRYLEKPVSPDLLREVVAGAARIHDLARVKRQALSLLHDRAREASDRAGLEAAFQDVLESLAVAFQPIAEISPRRIFAYEALLRSSHPSLPEPGSVLEAAGRLGRMHALGRTVRRRVAEAAPRLSAGLLLFVNVHPEELLDEDFFTPDSSLSAHARRVVLEVTERATLDSVPDLSRRIARLRALGYRLAVDDLGAGYAGLTSFAALNPHVVKLDMSLVRGADQEPVKQRLIGSMATLCKEFGIMVVAEGIETPTERTTVTALGCDLLQGFLVGRPAEAEAVLAALAARSVPR
ncbi:MAG TPA: EAL domain-containing response regulator, partial [Vicinamibacteria bacterium]